MSVVYTWKFPSIVVVEATQTVQTVHWRLAGTDGVNTTDVYGTQTIPADPAPAYNDSITKDTVQDWVTDAMGAEKVAELEASIANQLAFMANPPIVTINTDWN